MIKFKNIIKILWNIKECQQKDKDLFNLINSLKRINRKKKIRNKKENI